MVTFKTNKISSNTLLTKIGQLEPMTEGQKLIEFIEEYYKDEVLDRYCIKVTENQGKSIRGFKRYYSIGSILQLISMEEKIDFTIGASTFDNIDIHIKDKTNIGLSQSFFNSNDYSETLKNFCNSLYAYVKMKQVLKNKIPYTTLKDFCINCGLYNPKIDTQTTSYYILQNMLRYNIKPFSKLEEERWRTNPTEEEKLAPIDERYLTFLHPNLRDLFIENWTILTL